MQKFNNILLFGGKTKNENLPLGFYSSLAMLPLRGKPVIWWQIQNLQEHGLENVILVISKNNKKLIEYAKNILSENFKIKIVLISSQKNILSSLKYGLQTANLELPTRVILGDTMLCESLNNEFVDIIYTSNEISTSENWCLVEKQKNKNLYFYDKQKNINIKNKSALIGYYSFSDTKFLLSCCIKARLLLKKEISDALIMYQEKHSLLTKHAKDWIDLGHTSGLIKAKNNLFSARSFNSISVDIQKGLLIKSSTKIQKLEDEALWYLNLPEDLKIYAPRLINFSKNNQKACLVQELYGYPTLQELYLSGEVNLEDWRCIIEKLFILHKDFERYKKSVNKKLLLWLYFDKTCERLAELKAQNIYWEKILTHGFEKINGKKYLSILSLKKDIKNFVDLLCENGEETIIHGDYCFSNILFDSSNYVFKLIDPRGRLNLEATIYGDPRYDIAKLRHSIVGLYDFIVQDLFKLEESQEGFVYKIFTTSDYNTLTEIFDKYTKINGFEPKEIKFIEGLLFLSMIPLHKDNFNRQKMFYIRALELLNETLRDTNRGNVEWKKRSLEYV